MIDKMKSHLRKDGERINSALLRATAEKEGGGKELSELKAQFPKALARCYLGEIPQGEVIFLRRRMAQLQRFLDEFPSLYDELTTNQIKSQSKGRAEGIQTAHLERAARQYDSLKTELEEHYTADRESDFLLYARELASELGEDIITEAKAFLESIKYGRGKPNGN